MIEHDQELPFHLVDFGVERSFRSNYRGLNQICFRFPPLKMPPNSGYPHFTAAKCNAYPSTPYTLHHTPSCASVTLESPSEQLRCRFALKVLPTPTYASVNQGSKLPSEIDAECSPCLQPRNIRLVENEFLSLYCTTSTCQRQQSAALCKASKA